MIWQILDTLKKTIMGADKRCPQPPNNPYGGSQIFWKKLNQNILKSFKKNSIFAKNVFKYPKKSDLLQYGPNLSRMVTNNNKKKKIQSGLKWFRMVKVGKIWSKKVHNDQIKV